jgi:hypothetical protein
MTVDLMKKFLFNNHQTNTSLLIEAKDIISADQIYKEKTGLSVVNHPYIGCETKNFGNTPCLDSLNDNN